MRKLPLVGVLLLTPVHCLSFEPYHVRTATYGCVDPQAVPQATPQATPKAVRGIAPEPAGLAVRERGRCFRVQPGQRLEQISHLRRSMLLMRIKPPHPGEPPLYFRISSVIPWHGHHGAHARQSRHAAMSRPPGCGCRPPRSASRPLRRRRQQP